MRQPRTEPSTSKRLPTPDEAREGAVASARNAQELLLAADAAAQRSLYGPATSLAILSFEEAVKSRVLMAMVLASKTDRALGFTASDLRALIYGNHRLRHEAGWWQGMSNDSRTVLLQIMFGLSPTESEQRQLFADIQWVGQANARKQRGLYADFDPIAGGWHSPQDITMDEFVRDRRIVEVFLKETLEQLQHMQRWPERR